MVCVDKFSRFCKTFISVTTETTYLLTCGVILVTPTLRVLMKVCDCVHILLYKGVWERGPPPTKEPGKEPGDQSSLIPNLATQAIHNHMAA
jgi:hypothetical protein